MHSKRFGFTVWELLAAIVIIAVVAIILRPVYAPDYRPIGTVQDGLGHPIPGATLRFRDSAGRVITTVTADAHGQFRLRGLGPLCRYAIDGYALSWATHSTGGADQFRFTPLVTQEAIFHDTSGRPMSGLSINFNQERYRRVPWFGAATFGALTDRRGVAQITRVPAGLHFEVASVDRRYVIKEIKTFPAPRTVRYNVIVTAPATITGHLLTPDGTPLSGSYVYATQVSRAGHRESPNAVAVVGPAGRFRFRPLRPDRYFVSAKPLWRPGDLPDAHRVAVASGQTISVELRAPGPPPRRAR